MRLNRLDLTRYGKFTDEHIDFGSKEPGRPDLHIIYGPNEAGKSTALSAFLDLLFGIESRSRYGFLHPYATMRVGAMLELGGIARELVRIKKPQNSLLGSGDQPIGEQLILGELGAIDRDAYRAMFSLDDDTLEQGGESILASEGDLGQLLFSASTGLATLSQTLIELRTQADDFFKLRSRSSELGKFRSRLADLKDRREQIDTVASEYSQMVETRDRSQAQYNDAMAERSRTQLRLDEIKRLLNALPRLVELREIRGDLAPLRDIPEAPTAWKDQLPALHQEEIELAVKCHGVKTAIAKLTEELEALIVDEAVLGVGRRLDTRSHLHARYVTAERDLPERRQQLTDVNRELAEILRRLERPEDDEPSALLLGSTVSGAIRDLIERRSGVEATLQAAKREAEEAVRRRNEAQARLPNEAAASENGAGVAALARELGILREDDHAARRRLAEKSRLGHAETLTQQMSALRPWIGDLDQLIQMAVPEPAEMETWKASLSRAEAEIDRRNDDVKRLTSEQGRLRAELAAMENIVGVVSDHDAAVARSAREAAWAAHRQILDKGTAAVFEIELRKDDLITSARLAHTADLAKLHQAAQSLTIVEEELRRASELRDGVRSNHDTIKAQIAASVRTMASPILDNISLIRLEAWLRRREMALATGIALRQAEREVRDAEAAALTARNRLLKSLSAAGVGHDSTKSYETLLAEAQSAVDLEIERQSLREQIDDLEQDVISRRRTLEEASAHGERWNASWSEVCKRCWLGAENVIPDVATVREVLNGLSELGPAAQRRAGLADRIAKMEDDQAAFASELAATASELGLERSAESPLELWATITARVEQARAKQVARQSKLRSLEERKTALQDLEKAIAVNKCRKAEMTELFDVSSLEEVDNKLRMIERRSDLQRRADGIEREIREALAVQAIAEAEETLDAADRTSLEREQAELRGSFENQDRRTRDLFTAFSKVSDQVDGVGGDNAVAAIEEERRTVLLEIEDKAIRYFRLKAGIVAAEQALRAYRDKHRSSMMLRASDAFEVISRGAYRGLVTQPDKDSEVLIGISAAGSSKVAQEMSKGTRFQLYLALRVAGYHEFAQSRSPVPFIADDIMETFDDFRAEEAFRLFADMAKVGQVVYLTHHRHLCDIARRVCPETRVHELMAPVAPPHAFQMSGVAT